VEHVPVRGWDRFGFGAKGGEQRLQEGRLQFDQLRAGILDRLEVDAGPGQQGAKLLNEVQRQGVDVKSRRKLSPLSLRMLAP
jgi:hypothetical protein